MSTASQKTLLELLKEKYPQSSLSTLKAWITNQRISVNGIVVSKASKQITAQSTIKLLPSHKQLKEQLKIIYQDQNLVVVDKPIGLLSVATPKNEERCAHKILKEHFFKKRVYPVHRLDKDTSGLLVFALNKECQELLKEQFKQRKPERKYVAVVEGVLERQAGEWSSYLFEDPNLIMRETSNKNKGILAITCYETIYHTTEHSLISFSLKTGKKNQIRVQAAHRGHPIVGDKKYGTKTTLTKRMLLHAYTLVIDHPISHKKLYFKSQIPKEFGKILGTKVVLNEKDLSLQMG